MEMEQKRDSSPRRAFEPVIVGLRVDQQAQSVLFSAGCASLVLHSLCKTRVWIGHHFGTEVDFGADGVANPSVCPSFWGQCVLVEAVVCRVHDCVTLEAKEEMGVAYLGYLLKIHITFFSPVCLEQQRRKSSQYQRC